jgi:hypothetical protein
MSLNLLGVAAALTHSQSFARQMAWHPFFQYPRHRSCSSNQAAITLHRLPLFSVRVERGAKLRHGIESNQAAK